jgi:hypothetical protein
MSSNHFFIFSFFHLRNFLPATHPFKVEFRVGNKKRIHIINFKKIEIQTHLLNDETIRKSYLNCVCIRKLLSSDLPKNVSVLLNKFNFFLLCNFIGILEKIIQL